MPPFAIAIRIELDEESLLRLERLSDELQDSLIRLTTFKLQAPPASDAQPRSSKETPMPTSVNVSRGGKKKPKGK